MLSVYGPPINKAVRELFSAARRSGRPTLLFFDEFESLAAKRGVYVCYSSAFPCILTTLRTPTGKDNTGVTDRVVNQLLTFIDGVEDTMGSATTNGSERSKKAVYILYC